MRLHWVLKSLWLGALIAVFVGCDVAETAPNAPRVDGSSEANYEASIERILGSVPEEKALELVGALAMILLHNFDFFSPPEVLQQNLISSLDGKTADEIISYGNSVAEERAEREREQARSEANELRVRIEEINAQLELKKHAEQQLALFTVDRSRFSWNDSGFTSQPIIELTVTNGTESAVSRAYFKGVLATPGRSVPWVSESFNYRISGGIEPGETLEWSLSLSFQAGWQNAPKDRTDMILTIVPTRLDDAAGESLYNLDEYARLEAELGRLSIRLAALELDPSL